MTLKINIEIETDNAAFEENHDEVYRILMTAVHKIKDNAASEILRDINGNLVGHVKWTGS